MVGLVACAVHVEDELKVTVPVAARAFSYMGLLLVVVKTEISISDAVRKRIDFLNTFSEYDTVLFVLYSIVFIMSILVLSLPKYLY